MSVCRDAASLHIRKASYGKLLTDSDNQISYVSAMDIVISIKFRKLLLIGLALLLEGCQSGNFSGRSTFTLAVIPDTQNYIDFRHQKAAGFELDSSELFIQQMLFQGAMSW